MKPAGFAIILLAALPLASGAQTVYRCGPEGRTYSQEPCRDGKAVDVADPRTPEQRAEAERAAARTRALGDNLERERRANEAQQRAALAAEQARLRAVSQPASQPYVRRHIIRRHVVR